MSRSRNWEPLLAGLAALMVALALLMVFLYAPREKTMGDVQRIFYFHVSAAWVGFFAFFITMLASIAYLIRRERRWDVLALSSAEVGTLFITMVLVTGSLWARPIWNTWWTWEPRLTISAIQWLIYLAYFMLRGAMEEPGRRARFAAVYGIIAFITVPLSFMAIRWWRTIHPDILNPNAPGSQGGFSITPRMLRTLLFSIATFTVLYLVLLRARIRLEKMSDRVAHLRQRLLTR